MQMSDLGTFITMIINEIIGCFNTLQTVEFLGTNLLVVMTTFMIINIIITMLFAVSRSSGNSLRGDVSRNVKK